MNKHYKLKAFGLSLAIALAGNPFFAAQLLALGKHRQLTVQSTLSARKLKDVLNDLRSHYHVDILFSDQMVDPYNVPASMVNLKAKIEKNLESILKPLGLEYKKAKDGSFLITRTPAERKRLSGGELISEPNPASGMDSAQASTETENVPVPNQPTDITIKGKVTDEKGEGIPGVSVLLKGTTIGTATDINGGYSISSADVNGTLLFSYIGYLTEEVAINNRTTIHVALMPDIKALSEVVVVGYGTQRKSDLTGSVSSISPKEIKDLPVARVDQALQGRSPGVVIQNNDASPNGSVTIRIRGSNSITGSNDPLVVINGFIGGDLTSVNPNDIETIEVLKDASATAVYGSRGSNGVILITTKKGSTTKTVVQYNTFLNFQSLRNKLDLLSAGDYAETVNANRQDLNLSPAYTPTEVAAFKANGGTDWQNQIFRNALQQSHQLSVAGGNANVNYFLSANLVDNAGIIKGTSFKRYSVRSNIESHLSDKLKVGLNLFLVKSEDHPTTLNAFAGSNAGSPVFSARLWAPTLAVYNPDGTYTLPSSKVGPHTLYNPLAMAVEPIRDNRQNVTEFNTYGEYTLLKGLTARIMGGARLIDDENSYYINTKGTGGVGNAEAGVTNKRYMMLQNTNQLTYQKTIANDHNFNITAVYEQQREEYNSNAAGSKGFLTDALTYNNLGLGSSQQVPYSDRTTRTIQSLVGRINYAYQGKYSASLTSRYDGASVFGENHKWGFFPSVGLAWNINQEEFLKNVGQLSNLKLRTSYGVTGSQAIVPYASLDQLNTGARYAIDGSTLSPGVTLGSVGDPDLKWEKTAQFNVGLDWGLFNDRLQFTVDYYQKKTSDLLMSVPMPLTSGYLTKLKNVGQVENKGIELSLGGKLLDNEFKWSSNANLAINRNKVLALSGENEITLGGPGLPNFGNTIFLTVGQPIGVLKGYVQNGTWSTAEADEAIKYGAKPGYPKYIDQNNDTKIDDKDIVRMGNTYPKFTYGWTNTFSYKGLDLNVLIQGVYGNKIYNLSRVYMDRFSGDADATSADILNRWTPTHQDTDVPSFEGTNKYEKLQSSRWLENGSYLRVKNITLGYNLPKSVLSLIKLSAVRFYVSGVNLITFTKYTGYDPEARTNVDTLGGIDLASYPSQKAYTLGLNVTF